MANLTGVTVSGLAGVLYGLTSAIGLIHHPGCQSVATVTLGTS